MRAMLFAVLMAGVIGCGAKPDTPEPNVKLEPAGGSGTQPGPELPVIKLTSPKSLLQLDFVKLCEQAGPQRLSPEEMANRLIGSLHFQFHANECLAAQVAGSGFASPIAAVVRIHAQPEVVKLVKAGAEKPKLLDEGVSLRGSLGTSTGLSGASKVFLVIPGTQAETTAIFGKVVHSVSKAAVDAGATEVRFEKPTGPTSQRISYSTPDRKGTITLTLLLPDVDKKTVDALFPASDEMSRVFLVSRGKDETWLVAVVDEK